MRHERDDGLDTLDWLRHQPWYTGELYTYGPSYVGFVQWALAADAGDDLKGMAVIASAADFRDATYVGGSFSLDTVLTWAALLSAQRGSRLANFVELRRGQPRLHRGLAHLPLGEADVVATGGPVAFLREWLDDPGDEYWGLRGHTATAVTAPVLMIGGWYDIFLPWQLADHAALRAGGNRPRLIVGPWTHGSLGLVRESVRAAVEWFRRPDPGDTPVRLHVGGLGWREFADWPPAGARTGEWSLDPDGPCRFSYDPADPTPAVGGPRLVAGVAGRRDNRDLEARPDVLTFTGEVLAAPLTIVGPVSATVEVTASSPHFDLFVRLCEVTPDGRSWNLCDGLTRVSAPAERVTVELWPVAHRFAAGNRIRLQVSGGAHPRFARNTGTGEPLATATRLVPVDVELRRSPLLRLSVLA